MGSKGEDVHAAARNGDVHSVELIISSNPLAVNSRDKHSRTPLHLAAWAGHANVVSSLCKHKADVGVAAMDDMAAIHFAAQKGHLEVVKTLVASGVSIKATNRKGMTALHYAVQGSHVELTKYLLRKGSSLTAKTKTGKTPLDLASKEEIRCLILEHEKAKGSEDQGGKEKVVEKHKDEETGSGVPSENEVEGNGTLMGPSEDNTKRKGDKGDTHESSPKPKKTRVALGHLLASDDTQEDEEEL